MIHLVIDTNIYRQNPNRDNLGFESISSLAKSGLLTLHIPYVVQREFQTQQRDNYEKGLNKALSGLKELSRKNFSSNHLRYQILELRQQVEKIGENALADAEDQILDWARDINARLHPLCERQATRAMEAYFTGLAPLKKAKIREDIPDSFIVQSIFKIAETEQSQVHVVAHDNKLRDSFDQTPNFFTYASLDDFIENDSIQSLFKEYGVLKDPKKVFFDIIDYEEETDAIYQTVRNNIGEVILWEDISSPSIPSDDNRATISSYNDVEELELDFDKTRYFGNSKFGIPFHAKMSVYADYYMFKADFNLLDDVDKPSITDHNDHYFEAESIFDIDVKGIVSITIDPERPEEDEDLLDRHIINILIDKISEISIEE